MKKVVVILLLVISSLTLLISCNKSSVTPVEPTALTPVVDINILPSADINYGDIVNIISTIKNATSGTLSTDDGRTFNVEDKTEKEIQFIKNTNVTIKATNSDGKSASKSKPITVGAWDQCLNGLVNHLDKSWVLNDRYIMQNGVIVIHQGVNEIEVGEHFIYHINHTMDFYDKNDVLYWTPAGSAKWSLINNETQIQWVLRGITTIYNISVDKETMSLSAYLTLDGNPATIYVIYKIKE